MEEIKEKLERNRDYCDNPIFLKIIESINETDKRVATLEEINKTTFGATTNLLEQLALEVLNMKNLQEEVKNKMSETEEKLPSEVIKSKSFKVSVWKLVLTALVIPMINAFGLMLRDFLVTSTWDWAIILIVINSISIPAIIQWLSSTFSLEAQKSATEYEKIITQLKDERDAFKIKAGLSEYALEQAKIPKPDYDRFINQTQEKKEDTN